MLCSKWNPQPWLMLIITLATMNQALGSDIEFSGAVKDSNGFLIHKIKSPYQSGTTLVRVLQPDKLKADQRYPVVYVLPVEAQSENRYGDGLIEIQKRNLHNSVPAIFVAPAFSHLPWYADHPAIREIRQESYFLKVVVPFIDKTYPVITEPKGRYLLGFSKSGWGAYSLLLRNPDRFHRAVAWDAPLMMSKPGLYGSGEIFGTAENFELYQITNLLRARAAELREPRLILLGYGNFREEQREAHELMVQLRIPHIYTDGPYRKHDWHSGWIEEAVAQLFKD